jgi:hypothetical protein
MRADHSASIVEEAIEAAQPPADGDRDAPRQERHHERDRPVRHVFDEPPHGA